MDNKKNRVISIIISLLIIIVVAIGISLAYFNFSPENTTAQHGTTEAVTYDLLTFEGADFEITGDLGSENVHPLRIYNNTGVNLVYTLSFIVDLNEFIPTGAGDDITVDILPNNDINTSDGIFSSKYLVMPSEGTTEVVLNAYIANGEEQIYNVKLSFNDTGVRQNENMGKKFESHFEINNVKREHGNPIITPKIVKNLIPVTYDETKMKWVKSSVTADDWYNYDNQKWANAVIVTDNKKNEISIAEKGTVIEESDMVGMYVWIPRYEYKIEGAYGAGGTGLSSPGEIEVKFIQSTQTTADSGYIIHPAFTDGGKNNYQFGGWDTEIDGFWYGKFETSGNPLTPTVVPNIQSAVNMTFYDQYLMAKRTSTYQGVDLDSHISKNDEWGAVAYLSQSRYGKYGNSMYIGANKEIYINNRNGYITGSSAGTPDSDASYSSYSYNDIVDRGSGRGAAGAGASTSGTIYGVYDMNGGACDMTATNYKYVSSEAMMPDGASDPSSSDYIKPKYFNLYTDKNPFMACGESQCYGHALGEVYNNGMWYGDYSMSADSQRSLLARGCEATAGSYSGIYSIVAHNGSANYAATFRIVLTY